MPESLEHLLDHTLNLRGRHQRRRAAERPVGDRAIRSGLSELELRQARFSGEVRAIVREVMEQANRHLATRPETCEFREVPGYTADPWYPGGSICAPIACELLADGQVVGETLIIELTRAGMVEARLEPLPLSHHHGQHTIHFGWRPMPLFSFDRAKAVTLLVEYLAAITERWPLGDEASHSERGGDAAGLAEDPQALIA